MMISCEEFKGEGMIQLNCFKEKNGVSEELVRGRVVSLQSYEFYDRFCILKPGGLEGKEYSKSSKGSDILPENFRGWYSRIGDSIIAIYHSGEAVNLILGNRAYRVNGDNEVKLDSYGSMRRITLLKAGEPVSEYIFDLKRVVGYSDFKDNDYREILEDEDLDISMYISNTINSRSYQQFFTEFGSCSA